MHEKCTRSYFQKQILQNQKLELELENPHLPSVQYNSQALFLLIFLGETTLIKARAEGAF